MPRVLKPWVKQADIDPVHVEGVTTNDRQRLKALKPEKREVKQANKIFSERVRLFWQAEAQPPTKVILRCIADHRATYGVEAIHEVLSITPKHYCGAKRRESAVDRGSARPQ